MNAQEPLRSTPSPQPGPSVSCFVLLLCVALHVLIPKAGFKLDEVPVTVADMLFGILLPLALIALLSMRLGGLLKKTKTALFLAMAYFGLRTLGMSWNGETLARLVALSVYPFVLFALVKIVRSREHVDLFVRVVGVCVLAVLLYGLAQRAFGEAAVLVRGITANWSDAADPDFLAAKSNLFAQTGQLKLTSTYQNGNVLGVNLLLWFPVASLGLRRSARYLVFPVFLAVIGLTGSRSAWVGALVLFAVWLQTRPMSRKKRLFWAAVVVSATLLFVFYSSLGQLRVQDNLDEVVSWSGRLHGAAIIWMDTVRSSFSDLLLGIHPPEESYAYEMLYLSIYETYGVIGLLLWSLPFAFSLCAFFRYRQYPVVSAAFVGIFTWMVVSVAEGAFWLPPTSFNVWAAMGLGWCALISGRGQRAPSGAQFPFWVAAAPKCAQI